jgi:hypothetical protein
MAPPPARLAQLAGAQSRFGAAGLQLVAVELDLNRAAQPETPPTSPLAAVSPDVARTLALFRAPADGGETDLLLDRAGHVRVRWTASEKGGVPGADTLVADAERVAQFPASPESYAGHHH